LPELVPPETTIDMRARTSERSSVRVDGAHPDELLEGEGAREAADAQHRADHRQRRDDHVDALAAGQARVDHRARLVDAPVDGRDDAVDGLHELGLAGEAGVDAVQVAVALDPDLVGPVDHDLRDRLVGQQRLEHAEAQGLVDDLADERAALRAGEDRALAAEQVGDERFEAGAPLRRPELDELGEVDLLEQLALEVADPARGALAAGALALVGGVGARQQVSVEAVLQAHVRTRPLAGRLRRAP
jgi:hypothetical protein